MLSNIAELYELKKKISLERGRRLKTARNLVNLTRKDIELHYNINPNTLQAWEEGKNCLPDNKAEIFVDLFTKEGLKVSVDWLLHGSASGIMEATTSKTESTQRFQEILSISGDLKFYEEINYFCYHNPNSVSLMISDYSLSPVFNTGDYVGGINVLEKDLASLIGEFCIITAPDNAMLARKIIKWLENKVYMVGAINPYANLKGPGFFPFEIKNAAKITRHWLVGNNPNSPTE